MSKQRPINSSDSDLYIVSIPSPTRKRTQPHSGIKKSRAKKSSNAAAKIHVSDVSKYLVPIPVSNENESSIQTPNQSYTKSGNGSSWVSNKNTPPEIQQPTPPPQPPPKKHKKHNQVKHETPQETNQTSEMLTSNQEVQDYDSSIVVVEPAILEEQPKEQGSRQLKRSQTVGEDSNLDTSYRSPFGLNNSPLSAVVPGTEDTSSELVEISKMNNIPLDLSFQNWCETATSIMNEKTHLMKQLMLNRYKFFIRFQVLNSLVNSYAADLGIHETKLLEKIQKIRKMMEEMVSLTTEL
ncbi:uncharacterized protein J8A68_002885 [[Candida] subhashii]|uniref:Extracellular mutant protein 11 C-terminal domain-containing protein n=1 Tax=[Candida] subhashii TaxID=561895 RepID=A0A8J5QFR1_9ASCO|nr:uncharacterized protein J8A68_002885 [[Candida] subhashii]KAG7663636.1 hypothetical protein J8A68_002885 [[Candida] subhashii]